MRKETIDPQASGLVPCRVTFRALTAVLLLVSLAPLPAQDSIPEDESLHADIILRDAFLAEAGNQNRRAVVLFREYFRTGQESGFARAEFARVLSLEGDHAGAEVQIRRALELSPDSPEKLVIFSEVMRRAGKPAAALDRINAALGRIEDSADLEFQIAEIYYQQKDFARAQVHFRQVIFHAEAAGSRAALYRERALWRLANLHLQLGDEDRSRFYFVQFVRKNPENVFARFVLGYFLYFRRGHYDRAQRELEAIVSFPEQGLKRAGVKLERLYSALGSIYLVQEDHRALALMKKAVRAGSRDVLDRVLVLSLDGHDREALKYLGKYLKKDPTNFVARVARLRILQRMDVPDMLTAEYLTTAMLAGKIERYRTGISLAERGLAANARRKRDQEGPASHLYQQIAAHYEALNQYHRAILYLRRSIDLGQVAGRWQEAEPRRDLELAMARLLSRVGRHTDALALCSRIVGEAPGMGRAHYVRGNVYRRMKQMAEAERDFTKAYELEPKNFIYLFLRATIRYERKNTAGTEDDLKNVLKLKPDFAEAANFLGYMYAEQGVHLNESLRLIGLAIEASPVNGAFQDSLGWVLFRRGDFARARYHLQLAVMLLDEENQEDALVYEHLGDAHVELKTPVKALQAFRRGLLALEKREKRDEPLSEEEHQLRRRLNEKIKSLGVRGAENKPRTPLVRS